MTEERIQVALSFDIEDGISLSMRDDFNIISPQTDRVVSNTDHILSILNESNSKGTFFILGQVADKFPDLVKRVAACDHEIGVHGYNHFTLNKLRPEEAFNEVSRAKKRIEDITGKEVIGHRAPAFSLTKDTRWMFEILAEAGFYYDSSVLPANTGAFNWPDFEIKIVEVRLKSGKSIIEVPITVFQFMNQKVPFSGGGYLKLLPQKVIRYLYDKKSKNYPVIHYMHPYEIDLEKYPDYYYDALAKSGWLKSKKTRLRLMNKKTLPEKLKMITHSYSCGSIIDVIRNESINSGVDPYQLHF